MAPSWNPKPNPDPNPDPSVDPNPDPSVDPNPDPSLNRNANPNPSPDPNPTPNQDGNYTSAFAFAQAKVLARTTSGATAAGKACEVPYWELRAPLVVDRKDVSVSACNYTPRPKAAGVPRLLQAPAVPPMPLVTRSRSA